MLHCKTYVLNESLSIIVLKVDQVFRQLLRQLLQGKALSPEDMADILSLKDNRSSPEDYATALQILARAQVSPGPCSPQ